MSSVRYLICGESGEVDVVDSRPISNVSGAITRRRRHCLVCDERYTTHEVLAMDEHIAPDLRVHEAMLRKVLSDMALTFAHTLKGNDE